MKRLVSFIFVIALLLVPTSLSVQAAETPVISAFSTVEYLENGDYIITTLENLPSCSMYAVNTSSSVPGVKSLTYYNSSGTAIWKVTVEGWFSYTYGVSVTATSAATQITIYSSNASFVSKSAYTSGNTATATGTIRYDGANMSRSVSVSCDKYGNLY